ncbi:MAG TPA: APC family permease [Tepidisphaeraceae bacterium]|nr:APC family permease [Tepidisphaeraceae bacterium]
MADSPTTTAPRPTLGLTGLTSNAMALIAPGAFLWLTFGPQVLTGAPGAGMAMWFGILAALLLCLATAVAYAELSKLYPGAGSSYFFAEQAFLSKKQAFKWARVMKFMVGWASHLYYWVYPGVMVGVTALLVGYLLGELFPSTFAAGYPSPIFMFGFAIIFALGVAYIAFRGVGGTTGVNAIINVVQITALIIFSVMAITHRIHVKEGDQAYTMSSTGTAINFVQDTVPDTSKLIPDPKDPSKQIQDPSATIPKVTPDNDPVPVYYAADASDKVINGADGNPVVIPTDANGKLPATLPAGAAKAVPEPFKLSYEGGILPDKDGHLVYQYHKTAGSVIAPHGFGFVIIQACVAILILVGFESVTAMGEEAKNAKRDIPKAVILSLLIQGGFCYLLEYFSANYFMSTAYQATANASGSSAPIGDMMQLVGAWAFGSPKAGWYFMMIQAVTVFLALIGTTLSCLSTGARVTYAMGRDEEVPNHFGMLHGKTLSPHRAIWTLAIISIVIGCLTVATYYCGPAVKFGTKDAYNATVSGLPNASNGFNIWYKLGTHRLSYETACKIPQSLLTITLVSNFGTFLLYMMSCLVAIVAFHEHQMHNFFKHKVIPIFGLLANLLCMIFYLVGPFFVSGMSWEEPYLALAIAAVWGIYGAIYFVSRSKKMGKPVFIEQPAMATV